MVQSTGNQSFGTVGSNIPTSQHVKNEIGDYLMETSNEVFDLPQKELIQLHSVPTKLQSINKNGQIDGYASFPVSSELNGYFRASALFPVS